MHFRDEDLCMKHKIYEYTEEMNGDYKIKTIITGRCHLHGKPLYIPGFFGMTLSYCKDVSDCEIGAPINHSDIDDMSAKIRKLLVNTMLLAQIEEEKLKQYVAERGNMIANLEEVFFNMVHTLQSQDSKDDPIAELLVKTGLSDRTLSQFLVRYNSLAPGLGLQI